ncbi:MAG: glycosyltransferase family 2 protein [Planctomycetota bacterium]|jgi:glycosyltransferase involved in cell wall biosynthesis
MARVSVVIPTHNRRDLLLVTLDSALARIRPEDEVVVVDDGSTDGTAEALAAAPEQVRCISIENQGPAGARNVGIREARGRYIAFLDSDDLWLPAGLDAQVEALEKDERLGLSHAGSRPIDAAGNPTGPDRTPPAESADLVAALLERNFVTTSTVVVPRRALDRAGLFDEGLRNTMDWDLWLRIAEDVSFHALRETVCLYRFHEDQKIKDQEAVHTCRRRVLEKALERCREKRPDLVPLARRLLAYRLLRLGRFRLKRGERSEAKEAFRAARKLRPGTALTALRYRLTVRPSR